MNILLVHQYFHDKEVVGGSRFNEMVDFWAKKGHNITVLAGMIHYGATSSLEKEDKYKGKILYKEEYDKNITVIRCHVSESYNKNFLGRLWGYISFTFSSIWGGIREAKDKYDLVLVTSPPLFVGFTGYLVSRLKGVPLVFEVRDLWPESAIDAGVLKNRFIIKGAYWFEKFIYKKSKLINVLTPAFEKTMLEKKQIPKEKLILIPNATDFRMSDELFASFDTTDFRKELDWEGKFVVIYVGAHGVANDLIQMVQTAEILKENKDILLVCVGDGMQKKEVVEAAKERKLENIKFYPSVPKREVLKYIMAADAGASVLKKVDAFKTVYSNKTFDYMGCKKAILMVIDGVSRELVEKAEAGVYVEPENPKDFAEKINYLYQNPELVKNYGINGYKYAKIHFDRERLAEKYLDHLETTSNKKK